MKVPFADVHTRNRALKSELLARMGAVIDKGGFILGEEVRAFEAEFARYCGTARAVGVASGTDALHLALRAAGVGAGDEVLVPAHTFVATAFAAVYAGAKPVPVDVDPRSFLMDAALARERVTSRTKAVIPVHLYGRMMDLAPITRLAEKHGLAVIEDAAQAHGARLGGRRAGSVGALGCFSFYPAKNLGALGDGGLVTTSNEELAAKVEALRAYGSTKKYQHPVLGWNSRLDSLQATALSLKLAHLDEDNAGRRKAAALYNTALKGVGDLVLPELPSEAESHVWHLYVVRTGSRDALAAHLASKGVECGIHYPVPVHLHGAFSSLGFQRGDFPVAERLCDEILSLPMSPGLTPEQIAYVAEQLKGFFQ